MRLPMRLAFWQPRTSLTRSVTAGLYFALTTFCIATGHALAATPSDKESPAPAEASADKQAPEQLSPEEQGQREQWRKAMEHTPPPRKGCFVADYPRKEWREVRCMQPPDVFLGPNNPGPVGLSVNNHDIVAMAPSGVISRATGSFDDPTVASSVLSKLDPNDQNLTADAYSLQLNTNPFRTNLSHTDLCNGALNRDNCRGWVQFAYVNWPPSGVGALFVAYALLYYDTNCPNGWAQRQTGSSIHCYWNSVATPVPNRPISNLKQLQLTGFAKALYGSDIAFLNTGSHMYYAFGDTFFELEKSWTNAEFNVFGVGNNNEATFNTGAIVTPKIMIDYGGVEAPICLFQKYTGETNNLRLGVAPPAPTQPGPALSFGESSFGGIWYPGCAAATSVGDTHLATFHGLFYDFQASGDFVLAQVDPDFAVQVRQVSGAPTWPNASLNRAVAARVGSTKVALCAAPTRLIVDGKVTNLRDRHELRRADGTAIRREGNVYFVRGANGHSVRAEVNPTWININIGLGRWPVKVRGLVANPNGDVNQLEARDGTLLTNPFSFEELYHRFGKSWRVSDNESLLSVCGASKVAVGLPPRPFYAKHLREANPRLYQRARAVCAAAGVKEGPLMEACTLDVAVIGNKSAAGVFTRTAAPIAVGEPR